MWVSFWGRGDTELFRTAAVMLPFLPRKGEEVHLKGRKWVVDRIAYKVDTGDTAVYVLPYGS